MVLFLTAQAADSLWENDQRVGANLINKNKFVDNLKKHIKSYKNFVWIANNANDYDENDIKAKFIHEAFKKEHMFFDNLYVLDNRSISIATAKEILQSASLVFITGGKLDCQLELLDKLNFKNNISPDAVIIGQSAGSMNLGKLVFNYPETNEDLGSPLYFNGIGVHDFCIIPHFNCVTGNELCLGDFHLLNDYYLPESKNKTFYCLPNGSYILCSELDNVVYGESYTISNGKIITLCKNNKHQKI